MGAGFEYSNLGYYLFESALLERDPAQRRRTLEEAWKAGLGYQQETHLFFPHWDFGEADHFRLYGRIKREQAKTPGEDPEKALADAVEIFQKAVKSVQRVVDSPLGGEPAMKERWLGQLQYELGCTQLELYHRTHDPQLLEEAVSNLHRSAEVASRQAIPTHAGEALAKIGEAYILAGRFEKAQNAFLDAARRYHEACTKYPGLIPVLNSRASLMKARAATTAAQEARLRDAYESAAHQYREAFNFLRDTPSLQGLAALYEGWALLADAEARSRTEPMGATAILQVAIGRFAQAEKSLENKSTSASEEQTIETQLRLLRQDRGYAEARLLLEEARELERKGELLHSIEHLDQAGSKFDHLSKLADDSETQDLMINHGRMCRASKVMLQAEQNLNQELYSKAATLFQEVQHASKTKRLSIIAGGWAACCKALEMGLRYRESAEKTHFQALKKQLASAIGYFVEANSPAITSWLGGTGYMFDAIAHLAEAETSLDAPERKELYEQAERELRLSAEMFEKAGYPARQEDALRYLKSTTEQRQLITNRLVQEAPVAQSVSGLAGQTITQRALLSDQLLGTPAIHAAVRAPESPVYVGHEAKFVLTMLNPSQSLLRLVSVEGLGHPDMEVRSEPNEGPMVGGIINLQGRRLLPLTVHEVSFRTRPTRAGNYVLQPRVLFTDARGELQVQPLPSITMDVGETGLRSWLRGPHR